MSGKGKRKVKELSFEEYVEIFKVVSTRPEKVDRHTYRGRCPVCGDSKKVKNKKRFYIMRELGRKPCMVYCHNCGLSKTAYYFFQEICPNELDKRNKGLSEQDLDDIKAFVESGGDNRSIFLNAPEIEEITPKKYLDLLIAEVDKAKTIVGKFFDMCTYPAIENPEAFAYLSSRNIPEKYVKEMLLLRPEFHDHKKFRFSYFRDYIMVPFIDDGKPYYFHARRYKNLDSNFARFLSCPYRSEEVEVDFFLNEMRINSNSKPVVIAEGTYDSLNLENCIATNGVKKITDEQIARFEYRFGGSENIIYALDNEMTDYDAGKKAKELLKKGKRVFLWSLMAKDNPAVAQFNDFNALCVKAGRETVPLLTIEKYSSTNPGLLL